MSFIATYRSAGEFIDYTPSGAVAAGAVVVQGELIGIATQPIPASTPGALAIRGLFTVPKESGASTAIAAGAIVYWDAENQRVTTTASTHKVIGKTVAAATDADKTTKIILASDALTPAGT